MTEERPPSLIENFFIWMKEASDTEQEIIIFMLGFIVCLMMLDLFTGILAGLISKERKFKSKTGINGLLRTIATLTSLMFILPLSVLIPGENLGIWFVKSTYFAYIIFEWKSIIENLSDMKANVEPLKQLLKGVKGFVDEKIRSYVETEIEEEDNNGNSK